MHSSKLVMLAAHFATSTMPIDGNCHNLEEKGIDQSHKIYLCNLCLGVTHRHNFKPNKLLQIVIIGNVQ